MNEREQSSIILALDVDTVQKACDLMDSVINHVAMVKIGLEAINNQIAGAIAAEARDRGFDIFLDGKFDDIPNTVGKATLAAVRLGAGMINVHANAGIEAIRAAVANRGTAKILVVTVLTSKQETEVILDHGMSRINIVARFALKALEAGADGIICSAKELADLRLCHDLDTLLRVVPGTRSPGVEAHDQMNIDTPENAILNGADWLVIGRELTNAGNPAEAAADLNRRIAQAFEKRNKKAIAS